MIHGDRRSGSILFCLEFVFFPSFRGNQIHPEIDRIIVYYVPETNTGFPYIKMADIPYQGYKYTEKHMRRGFKRNFGEYVAAMDTLKQKYLLRFRPYFLIEFWQKEGQDKEYIVMDGIGRFKYSGDFEEDSVYWSEKHLISILEKGIPKLRRVRKPIVRYIR